MGEFPRCPKDIEPRSSLIYLSKMFRDEKELDKDRADFQTDYSNYEKSSTRLQREKQSCLLTTLVRTTHFPPPSSPLILNFIFSNNIIVCPRNYTSVSVSTARATSPISSLRSKILEANH